ncbi:MAG: BrnT family toxin [Desulfamplus sp.]|nr:BrnT family toxin [Desulfamplus sp.]
MLCVSVYPGLHDCNHSLPPFINRYINLKNLRGGGVNGYVFADPFALNKYDDEHSEREDRWILLGKTLSEAILVVVHTFREVDGTEFVRIISARKATKQEKQAYHKRCPK